ncbi:MAG TPA: acetyl-CoA carboxylase biotin carboxyl carrier protein subunit [Bacteroidales bacterium]|nr:acetyl-CoA carboxylase biotin carboxyl carrier protein subunit [Bacteroidales bacterium]
MNSNDNNGILNIDSSLYKTRISPKFAARKRYVPVNLKQIVSHIPGTILQILVSEGSVVKKGDDLLILDAMKMKNRIKCPADGKILSIATTTGAKVSKGSILLELE